MSGPVVAIVGGGPAGLRLASLLAAGGARPVVYDRFSPGGELMSLGVLEGVDGRPAVLGADLATDLLEAALDAGVEVKFEEVTELRRAGDGWSLAADGGEARADAVVLATGGEHGEVPVPHRAELVGQGISFCAGCDGPMFAGRPVAVIGDGPWDAGDAALLGEHAAAVHLVVARPEAAAGDGVVVHAGARPTAILEEGGAVRGLRLETAAGAQLEIEAAGVFVSAATRPRAALAGGLAGLDGEGRIEVDAGLRTAAPGLYAVGDVRAGAAGGVVAALRDAEQAASTILADAGVPDPGGAETKGSA